MGLTQESEVNSGSKESDRGNRRYQREANLKQIEKINDMLKSKELSTASRKQLETNKRTITDQLDKEATDELDRKANKEANRKYKKQADINQIVQIDEMLQNKQLTTEAKIKLGNEKNQLLRRSNITKTEIEAKRNKEEIENINQELLKNQSRI